MTVELEIPGQTATVANDRELLDLLGLNDAQAAMYLGRSRQALQNKLESKKHGRAPDNYFKPNDLQLLVIAARRLGALSDPGDVIKVRGYVEATRERRAYANTDSYRMLVDELGGADDNVDDALADAAAVIIIVPDYEPLARAKPELADRLADVAEAAQAQPQDPWIVVLSSTQARATTAADEFGLSSQRVRAEPSQYVDHYTPMVLIYAGSRGQLEPRPFMLTEAATLVAAPYFRGAMQTTCVRQMLPADVRADLFGPERSAVKRGRPAATGGR